MLKLSDMSPRSWTLFLVLEDGRELAHWTCGTRQGCRDFRRNMCDPTNGKMPRGLKTRVRKTFDIAAVAVAVAS